jgi:hypothetical protein
LIPTDVSHTKPRLSSSIYYHSLTEALSVIVIPKQAQNLPPTLIQSITSIITKVTVSTVVTTTTPNSLPPIMPLDMTRGAMITCGKDNTTAPTTSPMSYSCKGWNSTSSAKTKQEVHVMENHQNGRTSKCGNYLVQTLIENKIDIHSKMYGKMFDDKDFEHPHALFDRKIDYPLQCENNGSPTTYTYEYRELSLHYGFTSKEKFEVFIYKHPHFYLSALMSNYAEKGSVSLKRLSYVGKGFLLDCPPAPNLWEKTVTPLEISPG